MAKAMHQVKLLNIRELTPLMRELELEVLPPSEGIRFQAGQFVVLHVPQNPKPAPRAYSLASSEADARHFKLLIKLVPNGTASTFVQNLKGGEVLNFTGPFGKCLFIVPPAPQVIFLATGAGVSQHICFLLSKAAAHPEVQFRLLLGVWNESEIFYQDELNQLKSQVKNFSYEYVLDQPSPSWPGKSGFIQNHLEDYLRAQPNTHFYLCGNPHMIKAAKKLLLEDKKIPAAHIREEAFL